MTDIYAFLTAHGITYKRFDHPAVFTCEEAEKLPPMPGTPIKNLFLRDKSGKRHFLVVVGHEKNVDLKALKGLLGVSKLSFADAPRLEKYLGVLPGSVTPLGLVYDSAHAVEVFFDAQIWESDYIQCHPLVNTASVVISHAGLKQFLKETGHECKVIEVPER